MMNQVTEIIELGRAEDFIQNTNLPGNGEAPGHVGDPQWTTSVAVYSFEFDDE